MERFKTYVSVTVDFREDGTMLPRSIHWEDGRTYEIDRVVHICQTASDVGGNGDRYTIMVNGNQCFLFFESIYPQRDYRFGRWFVERKAGYS